MMQDAVPKSFKLIFVEKSTAPTTRAKGGDEKMKTMYNGCNWF